MGFKIWKFEMKIPKWLEKPSEVKARPMEPKPPRETRARKPVSSRVKDFFRKIFRPNKKDIQELRRSLGADYKKAVTVKDKIKVADRAAAAKQYDLASGLYAKTARYILRQSGSFIESKYDMFMLIEITEKMKRVGKKDPENKFLYNNYKKVCDELDAGMNSTLNIVKEIGQQQQFQEIMENPKHAKESLPEEFKKTRNPMTKLKIAFIAQDLMQYEMAAEFYKALAAEMISNRNDMNSMTLTLIYRNLYTASKRKDHDAHLNQALEKIEEMLRRCKDEEMINFIKVTLNELFDMKIEKFNF